MPGRVSFSHPSSTPSHIPITIPFLLHLYLFFISSFSLITSSSSPHSSCLLLPCMSSPFHLYISIYPSSLILLYQNSSDHSFASSSFDQCNFYISSPHSQFLSCFYLHHHLASPIHSPPALSFHFILSLASLPSSLIHTSLPLLSRSPFLPCHLHKALPYLAPPHYTLPQAILSSALSLSLSLSLLLSSPLLILGNVSRFPLISFPLTSSLSPLPSYSFITSITPVAPIPEDIISVQYLQTPNVPQFLCSY